MTATRQLIRSRPAYFRGQLLDEADFRSEQDYHRNAGLLHNTTLHSWGVVDGLTVSFNGEKKLAVAPGRAIDTQGREILLKETAILDVSAFDADQTVSVILSYEEGPGDERHTDHGEGSARMMEYSVLSVSTTEGAGVTLARVHLDSRPKVTGTISYAHTHYASSVLAPGQVGFRELAKGLRSGWVRLPFKPTPMENHPVFRIGATEARSTDEGASGSMAIPVPPGVTRVQRFRIAGEKNDGVITVEFFRCGWDPAEDDHEKTPLPKAEFNAKSPRAIPPGHSKASKIKDAFEYTETLQFDLDPQYHALAVVITVTKKTSISLVAVEFGYPGSKD
jgi:hypothetical protein